jgi:hypothetical protein
MKPVFSTSFLAERVSDHAFWIAELSAADVSVPHGEIHVGVAFAFSEPPLYSVLPRARMNAKEI